MTNQNPDPTKCKILEISASEAWVGTTRGQKGIFVNCEITVKVVDERHAPVEGIEIIFRDDFPEPYSEKTTNNYGYAKFTYHGNPGKLGLKKEVIAEIKLGSSFKRLIFPLQPQLLFTNKEGKRKETFINSVKLNFARAQIQILKRSLGYLIVFMCLAIPAVLWPRIATVILIAVTGLSITLFRVKRHKKKELKLKLSLPYILGWIITAFVAWKYFAHTSWITLLVTCAAAILSYAAESSLMHSKISEKTYVIQAWGNFHPWFVVKWFPLIAIGCAITAAITFTFNVDFVEIIWIPSSSNLAFLDWIVQLSNCLVSGVVFSLVNLAAHPLFWFESAIVLFFSGILVFLIGIIPEITGLIKEKGWGAFTEIFTTGFASVGFHQLFSGKTGRR